MSRVDRFSRAALGTGVLLFALLALTFHLPQRLASLLGRHQAAHRLDGRISPGEYQFQYQDPASQIVFAWSIVGDRLYGAVSSPDTGWVAVGFGGGGPLMYGADIVIGDVDAHGAHVEEDWANTATSHVPEAAVGGRDDLLGTAGLQTATGTTIEFVRPLAAHDTTQQAIVAGQTRVLLASTESKDLMAYHSEGHKAVALLNLFAGPPAPTGVGTGLPDHLTDVQLMLAAWMGTLLVVGLHGLAARWAEGPSGERPAEAMLERTAVAVALMAVLIVVELAALVIFAVGIAAAWPVWLLGSALAVGLLALAGIVVLYSRAFVRWELVRVERDDGIPW